MCTSMNWDNIHWNGFWGLTDMSHRSTKLWLRVQCPGAAFICCLGGIFKLGQQATVNEMEILEPPCQSTEELVRRSKGVKVLEIIYCMGRGPISKLLALGGQRRHYNNKDCAGEGEHLTFLRNSMLALLCKPWLELNYVAMEMIRFQNVRAQLAQNLRSKLGTITIMRSKVRVESN